MGKASAWKVFEDAHDLLEHLGEESQISADVLAKAEAFVCKLYNPVTQEVEINKERAAAFRKSKKDLDALPPTQDALILHIKQAINHWNKSLEPCPSLPKPEDSGWYYSEGLLKLKMFSENRFLASCLLTIDKTLVTTKLPTLLRFNKTQIKRSHFSVTYHKTRIESELFCGCIPLLTLIERYP